MLTTKEQIVKAMSELPDDADYQDAMDRLYLLYKIQRGIEQADAGKTMSQAEVKKRLRKLLQ